MKTLLLYLLASTILFAQPEKELDSLLSTMQNPRPEDLNENTGKLTDLFIYTDTASGKRISKKILDNLCRLDDKSLYIRVYLDSHIFYPLKEKIKIFNRGFDMAKEVGNENLIGNVYMKKAYAYKENEITDSAMVNALKAKSIFERTGNNVDLVHILMTIADLHYWAEQLDKAEVFYNKIIEMANDPTGRQWWVSRVALNDLGLIKIKQKKYSAAEEYFQKALKIIFASGPRNIDSVNFAYSYKKLMEVNLLQKKHKEAEGYYKQALSFAKKFEQRRELADIYIGKAELLNVVGKYDSALVYLKYTEPYDSVTTTLETKIALYKAFANTYNALNDTKNAYAYMELLRDAENKSDSMYHRAKYLNMYAEYNYENYLNEIDNYKKDQLVLILFLIVISLSLVTLSYYYFKLGRANKKIVEKNLEVAFGVNFVGKPVQGTVKSISSEVNKTNNNDEQDEKTFSTIINKLETLIVAEKLYLSHDISLDEVATHLQTNRAYVSKTINAKYNMNFSNYINTLRIKEAVRLISCGEHKVYSIEGLAQKSGFNNRVSFNQAFRNTGLSPSYFIKNFQTALVKKENIK